MVKELLQQALDEAKADAIYVFTYADGISAASKDAIEYMHSWLTVYFEKQPDGTGIPVDPSEMVQREQPSDSEYKRGFADGQKEFSEIAGGDWQAAVVDQLVVHHIYQAAHDADPRKAIHDLLCMNQSIALDPQVSSAAQALIDRGRKEAQKEQPAQEPEAWLIPSLASFKDAKSVSFSRVEGCTLTDAQLIEKMSGEVLWRVEVFSDGDGVIDKHGAHHAPKPLYTRPAPAQPALKDDVGVACLETMVKTMTNLGIATDSSLEGFGARLETHIYAMCRAVDGIFKARPALSDMECRYLVEQALTDYANLTWTPRRHLDTDLNSNPALVVIIAKAIEAHCRGCVGK